MKSSNQCEECKHVTFFEDSDPSDEELYCDSCDHVLDPENTIEILDI